VAVQVQCHLDAQVASRRHSDNPAIAISLAGALPVRGVTSAEGVTGPYDVVALAEARNLDEFGRRVMSRIQALEGVIRTLPCAVVAL
jgi:DNA-binding Lrp family transcriptional regulator